MTYKNLLVHIDDTEASAGRVAAAVSLARTFDAHLTGLYVAPEPEVPSYVHAYIPRQVILDQRAYVAEALEAAKTSFLATLDKEGLSGDCRTESALRTAIYARIALHARYADLAIVGQHQPDDPGPGTAHVVEDLVLSSGRPVLVIPYIGAGKQIGRKVAVAWDAGREAARAVGDAMPILERAESVHVVTVDARGSDLGHGEDPGADIALHLARHGIKADVHHTQADDIAVGDVILSWLADTGCDLLVMGAYAHSRLREVVLGGVTRRMLESMTVPVLMSH